jgi:diguanylate cyclase (GGDEF)-like protein
MAIDLKTLFFLTVHIEAMLGLLLLLVWVQGRATPAIAWWGFAHLLRSSSIALYGMYGTVLNLVSIGVADGILFSSYAVTWTGARIFDGRKPLPGSLLTGATVWLLACQLPAFAEASDMRSMLSAGIIATFMWLTAYELWRGRADGLVSRWPAVFIFFSMGAIFLLRTPLSEILPWYTGDGAGTSAWLTVISTEALLATISSAFILLAMAKERSELNQKTAVELKAERQIAYNWHHDGLTGLANRSQFLKLLNEELTRERDGRRGIAVHHIDLDHFKNVNDTLGHRVGDQLLRIVAERLSRSVRSCDIVARLGADEFGIVQVLTENKEEQAEALARHLIEVIHEPYRIEGHDLVVGASVGISTTSSNRDDADHLLKEADIALSCAKADGRHGHRFFEARMGAHLQSRRALELDLRAALQRQEFKVVYQPVINVTTEEVIGFEALLRWHHPERGLVLPDEFISLAEDIGVILPVGDWVLWQACADAAKWPEDLTLAVNISPLQFKRTDLPQCIVRALASAGLPTRRLELEITQSILLQDTESTLSTLRHLRSIGVGIVMDDFGADDSSLSYVRRFPFDKIKIDRALIAGLPNKAECLAIIRAAVGIAASLGVSTTAEGVETSEQLAQVQAEGCTNAQGFLFSQPMQASECRAFIAERAIMRATAASGAGRPPLRSARPRPLSVLEAPDRGPLQDHRAPVSVPTR